MAYTKNDELRMMSNPMLWPNLALPLVNRKNRKSHEGPICGMLNGSGPTIYLINMWDSSHAGKRWDELPQKTYESFEAMVEDGWEVD